MKQGNIYHVPDNYICYKLLCIVKLGKPCTVIKFCSDMTSHATHMTMTVHHHTVSPETDQSNKLGSSQVQSLMLLSGGGGGREERD